MLERYPYLSQDPSDASGLDTPLPPAPQIDWDGRGILIPVYPESKEDAAAGTDEAPVLQPEPATTWHDVALSIGAELMNKLRNTVKETLGYTMSAVCMLVISQTIAHRLARVYHETSFLRRYVNGQRVHDRVLNYDSADSLVQEVR